MAGQRTRGHFDEALDQHWTALGLAHHQHAAAARFGGAEERAHIVVVAAVIEDHDTKRTLGQSARGLDGRGDRNDAGEALYGETKDDPSGPVDRNEEDCGQHRDRRYLTGFMR